MARIKLFIPDSGKLELLEKSACPYLAKKEASCEASIMLFTEVHCVDAKIATPLCQAVKCLFIIQIEHSLDAERNKLK